MSGRTTNKPSPSSCARAIVIGVLFLLVAAVVATSFLGNPWYAIVQIGFYVLVVCLIAFQLRDCFRLAKAPAHTSRLKAVTVWLSLTVLAVVVHFGDMLRSQDKSYIRVATDLGVYIALLVCLELVKTLSRDASAQAVTGSDLTSEVGTKSV